MKSLIFVPEYYTYGSAFEQGFRQNNWDTFFIDWESEIPKLLHRVYKKTGALPSKLANYRKSILEEWINKTYIRRFHEIEPDLVFVYNNQMLLPDTLKYFKSRGAKVSFILGDFPLYSFTSNYNLQILTCSDYTIVPDSGWLADLRRMDIPNLYLDFMSPSSSHFYKTDQVPGEYKEKYTSNLLYIGGCYVHSAGYKRALFLSKFVKHGLKVFGVGYWSKWLLYFPELKNCITEINGRIGVAEYNFALNCCKICPIDINPGFRNGIHLRVFEAIAAGAYPIVEWTKDLETLFGDDMMCINTYSEAMDKVKYLIDKPDERTQRLTNLQTIVNANNSPEIVIRKMVSKLFR